MLNDVWNARGYYPVVGVAAFPDGKAKGKGKKGKKGKSIVTKGKGKYGQVQREE